MIAAFAFYLFATFTIVPALCVIFARNPVHSVLWLIVAFFNAAGLMLLVGAEFIAMLVVIVYVGAVAVLFLFVVMMLDIDFAQLRRGFTANLPFGIIVALVLLAEIFVALFAHQAGPAFASNPKKTERMMFGRAGLTWLAYDLIDQPASGMTAIAHSSRNSAQPGFKRNTHRIREENRHVKRHLLPQPPNNWKKRTL